MNRESFLETVRQHYCEEIRAAYVEFSHGGGKAVDIFELNKRLVTLMNIAKGEGLPSKDFQELVHATVPEVASELDLTPSRKAA